jgi:hypothetical protein
VGPVDAQQDERLRHVIGQLRLVVQVQLLERFENVIETPQPLPAILIGPVKHRR